MKTILVTAYAVNPYKGSEDGMGWNFILQIARFNKVIAITRENNKNAIDTYMLENPNVLYSNITFIYFDLPYWTRFWKKGNRGALLYYILWQYFIISFIQKKPLVYDIVHNLNFHNDWTPTFLWKLKKPLVWGSIGHHPLIPSQYLNKYSIKYWIMDRITWIIKQYFWRLSIHLHLTKKYAAHIFCMNSSVPHILSLKDKFSIMPSVASQDFGWEEDNQSSVFTVISAGRFVPLKGFDLTISAFAYMIRGLEHHKKNKCQLLLIGSGPEEETLRNLCVELNIEHHVKFISWMERSALMQIFKNASVFLFPSHEGAGMVIAEALSFGLPVVCIDNEGPGEFIDNTCGYAIPKSTYKATVDNLGSALQNLYYDKALHTKMRQAARRKFLTSFHWDRRGEKLQKIYNQL